MGIIIVVGLAVGCLARHRFGASPFSVLDDVLYGLYHKQAGEFVKFSPPSVYCDPGQKRRCAGGNVYIQGLF